ncbi:MAG: vitamin K epoxide reductase family protein, partial [Bacteroidota bacterium]
ITEFEKNWTGIVLLVEKLSDSGELAFEEKEEKEKSEHFIKNCWYVILSSFLVMPFFFLNISTSLIYFLKMIGGFASFMLLRRQFGYASSFIDYFCKMVRKSDCDAVIQSKSSKLLGSINISEVGLWYFSSGIITTSVSIFLPFSSDLVLLIISVGALLLSIVAIYVQAVVIKKWCPLCLVIASVILLELILRLISQPSFFYGNEQLFIVFFCFSLPLVFWLGIRARFLSSFKLFNKDRKLMRLLRNEEIFSALLEKQRFLETVAFNSELYSGFQDSPLQIVMVSNPLCGPCSKAHSVLNNLSETLGDKINIIYRFSLPKDANSRSYEMLRVLFTIQQTNNMKLALQALTAWYAYGKKDFSKWKKDFVNGSVDSNLAVDDVILKHINWVKEVRIKKTPTIFVNGKELPEEYSISDLKYHLRRMVESNEVSLMT